MKKTILVVAASGFIALFSTLAFACYWDGYRDVPAGGSSAGFYRDNYQGFYSNTAQLRQDLAAKQGEYNALTATPNPEPKRAAELNREISALHDKLSAQARSHNLPYASSGYWGCAGGYGCCW